MTDRKPSMGEKTTHPKMGGRSCRKATWENNQEYPTVEIRILFVQGCWHLLLFYIYINVRPWSVYHLLAKKLVASSSAKSLNDDVQSTLALFPLYMSLQQACSQSNVVGINAWRQMRDNFICQSVKFVLPCQVEYVWKGFIAFNGKVSSVEKVQHSLAGSFGATITRHPKQGKNTSKETRQSKQKWTIPSPFLVF